MPSGVYKRIKKHGHNISKAKLGIKLSKEHRQNMSKAKLGIKLSKEHKCNISKARMGMKFSRECRLNMSRARTKHWASMTKEEKIERTKVAIKAALEANQERWDNMTKEERRLANRAFQKAGTKAMRNKFVKMTKEERKERCRHWFEAGIKASQLANPSSIEKSIWKELDKLNICYEIQVLFNHSRFIVDIYVPIWKLIIECNGDYYHNYKMFPQSRVRDEALERYAYRNDLKIIWLWEHNIRNDSKQALLSELKLNNIIL